MLYTYPELTPVLLLDGGWQIQTDGVFSKVFGACLIVLPLFETDYPETKGIWVFATRKKRVHTRYYRDMTRRPKNFTVLDIINTLNMLPSVPPKTWERNGVHWDDSDEWWIDTRTELEALTALSLEPDEAHKIRIEPCLTPECLQFQHFVHTKKTPDFMF